MKEEKLKPLRYRFYYINRNDTGKIRDFIMNKLDNGGILEEYRIVDSFSDGNMQCFILEHINVKYEKVEDKIIK